jgi:hypothetical protein
MYKEHNASIFRSEKYAAKEMFNSDMGTGGRNPTP